MNNKLTEAQLAEQYDAHGAGENWETPEPLTQPTRREVTLSVRFSADEIAAIRHAAKQTHEKPTAFIRAAALSIAGHSTEPPNKALDEAIEKLAKDLDQLRNAAHSR